MTFYIMMNHGKTRRVSEEFYYKEYSNRHLSKIREEGPYFYNFFGAISDDMHLTLLDSPTHQTIRI